MRNMRATGTKREAGSKLAHILALLMLIGPLGFTSLCLAAGDQWARMADMPTARTNLSTCVVDGIIYAIGGLDAGNLSTVEAYDPAKNEWEAKADMSTARQRLSTSVVDGIIYAIGGESQRVPFGISTPKVEAYDPANDKWETKADMPTRRTAVTTCVVDGIIYAIGGYQDGSGIGLKTVEAYDPASDKWEKKADMPVAICFHTASVVDEVIYVIGGGKDWRGREIVAVYDPAQDMWEEMNGVMPSPRADHSASVVDGIIYTFGGTAFPPGNQKGLDIVEAYNPTTDTWEKKAEMPTARMDLSTSAIGGRIYAIGGAVSFLGATLPIVEEYTPSDQLPFPVSSQGKLPTTWGERKSH
jgi:N-acetylneuraminic acid mutarotase